MRFNPKLTITKYMAQIKFNSMSPGERIAYANLLTGKVSDLVVITGLDLVTEAFLDLTDKHKKEGKTWLAKAGNRWFTVFYAGAGMPSWECALTALYHAGARKIIRIGVGGSLNPDIAIGDLFIPTEAWINDETSRKYTTKRRIQVQGDMLDFVKEEVPKLVPPEIKLHFGAVTSSNYLFAQSVDEMKEWSKSADFVDMESSLLMAFCEARGLEGMSILIASDDKLRGKDLFTMPDYPMKTLFENGDFMHRALIQGIKDYNVGKPDRGRPSA